MPSDSERIGRLERIVLGQDALLAATGDAMVDLADPERVTTTQPVTAGKTTYGFNATTDVVELEGPGPHAIATFGCPHESPMDLWMDRGDWAASVPAIFKRIRSAGVQLTGQCQPGSNRGGELDVHPCGELHRYGCFTRAGGSPVVTKTLYVAPFQQAEVIMAGDIRVRPGKRVLWTVEAPGAREREKWNASVYLQWWERPAT